MVEPLVWCVWSHGPTWDLFQTGQCRLVGAVSSVHTVGHSTRCLKSTAVGVSYLSGMLAKYSIESLDLSACPIRWSQQTRNQTNSAENHMCNVSLEALCEIVSF